MIAQYIKVKQAGGGPTPAAGDTTATAAPGAAGATPAPAGAGTTGTTGN